jgi:succinoglycan biosynthesis protein ExoA
MIGASMLQPTTRAGVARLSTPFVSIILPIRNEERFIGRCLEAIMVQDYPRDRFEVLVSDGMSTDQTRKIVASYRSRFGSLRLIDNPGGIVSTGLNAAVPLARGDIVIRVDGHCEIAQDYLRCCVEHLLKDGVDGVGGHTETVGGTWMARAIALAMNSRFGVGSSFRTRRNQTILADTIVFPAYTREIMAKAGPFDEELVRNQDDEYNYRLRKLGARLLEAADVHSRYYSRSTLGSLWRQYFQYGYWKVRVLQKHSRQMQPRQFVPPLFVAALASCLLAAPFSLVGSVALAVVASSYAVANLGASLAVAGRENRQLLPLLPVVFAILHVSYGLGFLVGLARFSSRWRRPEHEPHGLGKRALEGGVAPGEPDATVVPAGQS